MRCLHVMSGDLWAGAEVSAYHTLVELAARDGIAVHAVVLNPGALADRLQAAGIETTIFDERSAGFVGLARRLSALAAGLRPTVVHSHRYKEHLLAGIVAARTGCLHVRTAHGRPPQPSWNGTLGGMASLVDGALASWIGSTWIAVSRELGDDLAGLRRTVRVVPNGLPDVEPPPRREALEGCFDGEPGLHVGFVGRLDTAKRPDRFVDVLASLPESISSLPVRGVLIGAGPLAPTLEARIRGLGLGPRVRLLGHRDDAESLIAALDVLLIPSDREGLPMVLLEAMRSGVPVVASGVGGIREWLGAAPFVLPPHRVADMARATTRLLSCRASREEWSSTLRREFLHHGSVRATATRLLEIYREALAA